MNNYYRRNPGIGAQELMNCKGKMVDGTYQILPNTIAVSTTNDQGPHFNRIANYVYSVNHSQQHIYDCSTKDPRLYTY